jgi:hypothetical protein
MLILKQVQDDITRFSIPIEIPKQVRNDTIWFVSISEVFIRELKMKTDLECYECAIKAVIRTARIATDNQELQKKCVLRALQYLLNVDLNQQPPVFSQKIYKVIEEVTGNSDPYKKEKTEQNKKAMKMINDLKNDYNDTKDKLYWAMRLSLAGNSIDCGVGLPKEIEKDIKNLMNTPCIIDDYIKMCDFLEKSKSVLFLTDNTGEIAFDKVLIEEILKGFRNIDLIVAVKSGSIINDATMEDAKFVRIDKLAKVIENIDYPGAPLFLSTDKFKKIFHKADLIISKGQGNYETLEEEPQRFVFLLKVKCTPVAKHIGVNVGSQLIYFKDNKKYRK